MYLGRQKGIDMRPGVWALCQETKTKAQTVIDTFDVIHSVVIPLYSRVASYIRDSLNPHL
jgi:hypothetical protein